MTEMKISKSTRFNTDEITSMIKLVFGTVSKLKTTKTSYVFFIDNYRGNSFVVGALVRYLGVDAIQINGKSVTHDKDANWVLKRRAREQY